VLKLHEHGFSEEARPDHSGKMKPSGACGNFDAAVPENRAQKVRRDYDVVHPFQRSLHGVFSQDSDSRQNPPAGEGELGVAQPQPRDKKGDGGDQEGGKKYYELLRGKPHDYAYEEEKGRPNNRKEQGPPVVLNFQEQLLAGV
jgi:hypothetical protein